MFYRENGQFKTSYRSDQQIFAIAQDRWAILALIAFAAIGVPMLADEYMFRAILIPFLILALAALGVNILVGYCGQISLGSGAFMAVGAYAAFNFFVRIPGIPLLLALVLGGHEYATVEVEIYTLVAHELQLAQAGSLALWVLVLTGVVALAYAAIAGLGIALKPTFIVGEALRDGRLVPVLPGWSVPPLGVHAVWPPSRYLPFKTRAFIDHLAACFGPDPYWDRV